MAIYTIVFFGAAFLTQVATLIVARFGRAMGLVDHPGARKVHKTPVPRIGGVAIVLGAVTFSLGAMGFDNGVGLALRQVWVEIAALTVGGLVVFAVGFWDDIRPRPALLRLLVLLGAAVGVALSGARIESLSISASSILHLGWFAWPVTVLWIVGVTVAVNFIDGLDGLAAGIALVVCSLIALLALLSGQIVMAVLMLAMSGSLTGFLFFNFNPAKIFMGDCGSMFLGFMIGGASVVCQAKTHTLVGIAVPALALGLPILDTLLTFIRRKVLDRRSIFAAERGHIHHRLLEKGLSHKTAVLALYGVTLAVAGMGMLMMFLRGPVQLVAFAGGVVVLLMAFRVAGAGRLRETVAAIQRNTAIAQDAKKERNCYDDVQLHLRQAHTFEEWWDVAGSLAGKMEFDRMAVDIRGGGETHRYLWMREGAPGADGALIDVLLPVAWSQRDLFCKIELSVRPNSSMEAFGRRLSLFGRMLDECPPPSLQTQDERDAAAAEGNAGVYVPEAVPAESRGKRAAVVSRLRVAEPLWL
jgi:UDP-N-acetylmuramyl pentapeptide phosphotransferase/UDP-N-acetylglucosamine-1-phosphate transferase